MTEATEPVTVVLLILLFVLVYLRDLARTVRDRVSEWWSRRTALSPVEQLQEEYARGEIDEEELERRLTFALDERAETVRREIEAVDGVGPGRSAEIAEAFESVESIRRADREDLMRVRHVGEETAEAIKDRFSV